MDADDIQSIEILYNDGEIEVINKTEFVGAGFHENCVVIQFKDGVHQFTPLASVKKVFLKLPK